MVKSMRVRIFNTATDDYGRIKYRIDLSDHGNPNLHTDPHIHEYISKTNKGVISENEWYIEKNI